MSLPVRAQSVYAIGCCPCMYSFVVCSKQLLASDVANLCLYLPMLQGSLFCSKPLNFFMCDLVEALPKLIFVVVVLISTL
jgi:hypothetical protein